MMQYINNTSNDPYFNLALEEYVFLNKKQDDIFMLWVDSPSLVIGCYQNIFAETDVSAAENAGISLLRRISGGGTVYHDRGNLNYTFIKDYNDKTAGYDIFLDEIIDALNRMGIGAYRNRSCDIAVDGMKVSGSAQKASGGRVLHHGTLLFDTDLCAIGAFTKGHSEVFESKGIKSSPHKVGNIKYLCKPDWSIEDFYSNLFDSVTHGNAEELVLYENEICEIEKLASSKYRSDEWLFGKNPYFKKDFELIIDGAEYKFSAESKNGVIIGVSSIPALPECRNLAGRALYGKSPENVNERAIFHEICAYN